jgi:hypothetical protein
MNNSLKAFLVAAAGAGLMGGTASAQSLSVPGPRSGGAPALDQLGRASMNLAQSDNKHACKGQNSCKGQGGCNTGDMGCKGKNTCKGKGGCNTM